MFTKEETGTENSWLAVGHIPSMEQNYWEQSSALLVLCFSLKMIFPSDLSRADVRGHSILLFEIWKQMWSAQLLCTEYSHPVPCFRLVKSKIVSVGWVLKPVRTCIRKYVVTQLPGVTSRILLVWQQDGFFHYSVIFTLQGKFAHWKHPEFLII